MSNKTEKIASEGVAGFDWAAYEDGWDGKSYGQYNQAYINDAEHAPYSHDAYIKESKVAYTNKPIPKSKELKKDALVEITDFMVCRDGNSVLATINGGANNVIIDLTKENKFFGTLTLNDEAVTKDTFLMCVNDKELKNTLIQNGIRGKVGTDVEKASLWDGHVEYISNEMRESIRKGNSAYHATVISSNNGGFIVEIANTIRAFMPGSMASANRLFDHDGLVGTTMEVMVESYDDRTGFVVSRKKYLQTIIPDNIRKLKGEVKKSKDMLFHGTVTDTKPFGVFVEMDGFGGCLTGMIHKTLMSDGLRAALRDRTVKSRDRLDIYVHKIEKMAEGGSRIIFSDVPSSERAEVIQRREAEDLQEKNTYVAAKRDAVKKEAQLKDAVNAQPVSESCEAKAE